jgi:enediyne biosynthesis protein E4
MNTPSIMGRYAARSLSTLLIISLYWFTRLPQISSQERSSLAAQFAFTSAVLQELPDSGSKTVRAVHPSLERISAWISSVGASVALNDLDGDSLPNDVCYVNTRTDQVVVASVPNQSERYDPFELRPDPILYNPSTMAPMGCLPGDFNEDGRMDVLVYYWGRTPIAFLQIAEDVSELSTASFLPLEIVAGGQRWFTNAATAADLDGDGHTDLVIGNYFPDGSQILDAHATDKESMQHSMSRAYNGGHDHLLLWRSAKAGSQPSVFFQESAEALSEQVAAGWTLAVGAADLDGDLLPELYFANDFGPDRLLHNRSQPGDLHFVPLTGVKTFTTPNSKVLGRDSFKGMGVDFGDLNGDGLLDIFVSNIADEFALEESHFLFINTGNAAEMQKGKAPYIDRSESLGLARSGWGWEARLDDFNNDGILEVLQATGFIKGTANRWPELHELAMGNDDLLSNPSSWPRFQPGDDLSGDQHNPFFVRASDGRYYDLACEIGLCQPQVTRGIAVADVDRDGDLDFAVANQWEVSTFHENECPACGSYLGLHLVLPPSGILQGQTIVEHGHSTPGSMARPAIGATAIIHLPDGQIKVAQVDGGNGHSGKRAPNLHFGLGAVSQSVPILVDLMWRDPLGTVHKESIELVPGWHTVWLASR